MKHLTFTLFFLLLAPSAFGFIFSMAAVDDYGLTYDGTTYGLDPDPLWLKFDAGPDLNRSIVVFDKHLFTLEPIFDSYTNAAFRINSPAGHNKTCQVTAYSSDTMDADLEDVIEELWNQPGRYLHFKLSTTTIPCAQSWCDGYFYGLNNPDSPGHARFYMSHNVPVGSESRSWGTIKSLYR